MPVKKPAVRKVGDSASPCKAARGFILNGKEVASATKPDGSELCLPAKRDPACAECKRRHKQCDGNGHGPCRRCTRLKLVCERPVLKDNDTVSVSVSVSPSGSGFNSVIEDDDVEQMRLVPVRTPEPKLEYTIVSVLPPIPESETLNWIMGRYFTTMYDLYPLSVRPLLVEDLGQSSRLPPFSPIAILLWSERWDDALPRLIGFERRSELLQMLYERLQAQLIPGLEFVLAGYDAMVGKALEPSRMASVGPSADPLTPAASHYIKMAVCVLQALVHLLGTIISVPCWDGPGVANFRHLVELAASVAYASRLADEHLYGTPVIGPWDEKLGGFRFAHYSSLIERGRRAWWLIVCLDNFFATMQGTDPVIQWLLFTGVKMPASDHVCGMITGEVGDPGYAAEPNDWSVQRAGAEMPPGVPSIFQTLPEWSGVEGENRLEDNLDAGIATPASCIMPDGAFSQYAALLILSQLHVAIGSFRRNNPEPWKPHPRRTRLLTRLHALYAELPNIVCEVVALLSNSPRPIPPALGTLAHLVFLYHSAVIAICAPSEAALWKGQPDRDWFASEAFLEAQENAIKGTSILAPLTEPENDVPDLGLPVSLHLFLIGPVLIHGQLTPNNLISSSSNTAPSTPA